MRKKIFGIVFMLVALLPIAVLVACNSDNSKTYKAVFDLQGVAIYTANFRPFNASGRDVNLLMRQWSWGMEDGKLVITTTDPSSWSHSSIRLQVSDGYRFLDWQIGDNMLDTDAVIATMPNFEDLQGVTILAHFEKIVETQAQHVEYVANQVKSVIATSADFADGVLEVDFYLSFNQQFRFVTIIKNMQTGVIRQEIVGINSSAWDWDNQPDGIYFGTAHMLLQGGVRSIGVRNGVDPLDLEEGLSEELTFSIELPLWTSSTHRWLRVYSSIRAVIRHRIPLENITATFDDGTQTISPNESKNIVIGFVPSNATFQNFGISLFSIWIGGVQISGADMNRYINLVDNTLTTTIEMPVGAGIRIYIRELTENRSLQWNIMVV